MSVSFSPHKLTPNQWPTEPTSDWLVPSPSLHKWGRRILLYDMFSSLGPYEWFEAFTCVVLFLLYGVNGRLHRVYVTEATSDIPPLSPTTQMLYNILYNVRYGAFGGLLFSYYVEINLAIPRTRLVE